ncbi:MAG: HEAT repeat domain-containing protein [Candidatus Paceibacterota bacterium]
MAGRSFKSDDSFLRKLAIGAFGNLKVIENLQDQGYSPIELERGSTGYKIWKSIKIKRVRVPDILCLNSGVRIESRAKSKLVISMSHSNSDETRSWNFGLKDDDYVALVKCESNGDDPLDLEVSDLVQYIRVEDLNYAFENDLVHDERQKGFGEGFESRITWPASFASSSGKITNIDDQRIQFERIEDGRTITLQRTKKGIDLTPLVKEGEEIVEGKVLASVVNVTNQLNVKKDKGVDYYLEEINSLSISDRYGAAKALAYFFNDSVKDVLIKRLSNEKEHIYIKLEAAASLIKNNVNEGYDFILSVLVSQFLEQKLEAVIILSEINNSRSIEILSEVLHNDNEHNEIRAGAAWSIGEIGKSDGTESLIESFKNVDDLIRVEAVRALAKITERYPNDILEQFKKSDAEVRPGIAWALSKRKNWNYDILNALDFNSVDSRQWAAYILGTNKEADIIEEIEKLKKIDEELYFAVTVLWKKMSSWVFNLEEY